jgi:hypothetical protein
MAGENQAKKQVSMDSSDSHGLIISLMIGIALLAACGVVTFVLMLVAFVAL